MCIFSQTLYFESFKEVCWAVHNVGGYEHEKPSASNQGNPAFSSWIRGLHPLEIRGFPSPPHGGFGFSLVFGKQNLHQ